MDQETLAAEIRAWQATARLTQKAVAEWLNETGVESIAIAFDGCVVTVYAHGGIEYRAVQ